MSTASETNDNNNNNNNNINRDQDDEDLWIFGYGSLIWKVNFEFEEAVPCYIKGYKRVFWQGSTDHRGIPGAPGRVVTLIHSAGPEFDPNEDDDASTKNNKTNNNIVHGVCFRINQKKINETLIALDIREQGGYDREFVTTYLHKVPTKSNPENVLIADEVPFFLQKNQFNSDSHVEEGSVLNAKSLCYIANERNCEFLGPGNSMTEMAVQIFSSKGPSGSNVEYLIKLCDGLRALHAPDEHCFELERLVLEIARQKNHDNSVELE